MTRCHPTVAPIQEKQPPEEEEKLCVERNREAINKDYKKYRIFVHTSDTPVNGIYRAVYTVLDQDGRHLLLNFVEDPQQKKACTKAFNAAKKFVDSLNKSTTDITANQMTSAKNFSRKSSVPQGPSA